MKKVTIILTILIAAVGFSLYSFNANADGDNTEEKTKSIPLQKAFVQEIVAVPSPKKATFAGELVPVSCFDVDESLSRELTSLVYGHGMLVHTLRLTERYFPTIEPILQEQGIPDDFKYLCVAESNLQNVVSPAKAAGYWQFLEGTAKQFGLEVNDEVDERYHMEKATLAACKYFNAAYKKYGNWSLAAASYNVGMGHIDQQIIRQKTDSYYDMALNIETARYVYRSVAYKEIIEHPQKFGFNIAKEDFFCPLEYDEVKVSSSIANLADFAENNGTNYKMVKLFNPWLRKDVLTNKTNKTYTIRIPKKGFRNHTANNG